MSRRAVGGIRTTESAIYEPALQPAEQRQYSLRLPPDQNFGLFVLGNIDADLYISRYLQSDLNFFKKKWQSFRQNVGK